MLDVSDGEITQRVKDIIDVDQPDWTGMPLPYNAENNPPQVKAKSLLPCFFNNLDVLLTMAYQDVIPLGPIIGGIDIGSDDDEDPKQLAVGAPLEDGLTQVPTVQAINPQSRLGGTVGRHRRWPD